MKFKIDCDSPLLQESLEVFLKNYLDENGIIISDNEKRGQIIIGKEIKKPFTKASLILQLEKILNKKLENKTFEEKLDEIIENFKKEIKNLIKEYYGKR